jgi:hypothetical protein
LKKLVSLWQTTTTFYKDIGLIIKGAWFNLKELFKNYIYSSSESEVQSGYSILRQNWVTELTGYATWTMKFMHTQNYLSASTLTESLAISTG